MVTIKAVQGDGIIQHAKEGSEQTEIAKEKEVIFMASNSAIINNEDKKLIRGELEGELDKLEGNGKTEVVEVGEGFEVLFKETNRYYLVDKNGNVEEKYILIEDKTPGDITKDKDGNILAGTEEEPYEIWCIEDLLVLSNLTNGTGYQIENGEIKEITRANAMTDKHIKLMRTLDFKSKYSYVNSQRTDFGDINGNTEDGNVLIQELTTEKGFRPIRSFNGHFDGGKNKIKNIYIDYLSGTVPLNIGPSMGLFSNIVNNAAVENLEVASGVIKGDGHTGGIVGDSNSNNTTIKNCINRAKIVGYNMVGGIAGRGGYIYNCKNYGDIEIIGACYQYGGAGGIAGNVTEINNCKNYGNILGKYKAGGIVGSGDNIKNCINYGNVEPDNNHAGGIVARVGATVNIINCGNEGNVIGSSCGGIIGQTDTGWKSVVEISIKNCYNIGQIQSVGESGGIIGYTTYIFKEMTINIENVYNIGELKGKKLGGIIASIGVWDQPSTSIRLNINHAYFINEIGIEEGRTYTGEITKTTAEKIKSQSFVDTLNNNIKEDTECLKWKLSERMYPILDL